MISVKRVSDELHWYEAGCDICLAAFSRIMKEKLGLLIFPDYSESINCDASFHIDCYFKTFIDGLFK